MTFRRLSFPMPAVAVAVAIVAVAACSPSSRDASPVVASDSSVVTLAVAGRNSENVSVAARGPFVAVSWSAATDSATDIYSAVSRDGGASFGAPVRVNRVDGEARVNGEMPPRVALIPRDTSPPEIVVVWTDKAHDGWRVLHARSIDGGASFGETAPVPGGAPGGDRGWQSIAVDSAGRVIVVWLDHRDFNNAAFDSSATASSAGASAMSESERRAGRSMLYVSSLGGTPPHAVVRSVCYCCKTSMVADGGTVYAVWRHVYPGNERDIAFASSSDGGASFSAPVRVSADRWVFDGCPDNGPAVAIDRSRRAHVLWVTPKTGEDPSQMELYHAVSGPNDGSFSARERVATSGLPGHVQLTIEPRGTLLMAWDETGDGSRRVVLARATVDERGTTRIDPITAAGTMMGDNPAVAATDSASLVAWVRTANTDGKREIALMLVR